MSPLNVKLAFERRGAYLNPGVNATAAIKKVKAKNLNIDPYILDIYSLFNGFRKGALDPGSGVRIWPLEDVLAEVQEGRCRLPFADFLLMSNEYTFDLENASAPIFLDEEEISKSLPEFLGQLLSGRFDF
jgi:hypothetical protein